MLTESKTTFDINYGNSVHDDVLHGNAFRFSILKVSIITSSQFNNKKVFTSSAEDNFHLSI